MTQKKLVGTIALISLAALLAGEFGQKTSAVSFDTLDQNTAIAGASVSLRRFYQSNLDAEEYLNELFFPTEEEETETETEPETEPEKVRETYVPVSTEIRYYDVCYVGKVKDTKLNVRKSPSTSAEIVGTFEPGERIVIIGEQIIRDKLWYVVENTSMKGFSSAEFIEKTGETYTVPEQIDLPTEFVLPKDAQSKGTDAYNNILKYANDVNYCLKVDMPAKIEAGDPVSVYSVLIYIMNDKCGMVKKLAEQYGMKDTLKYASETYAMLDRYRESLCNMTGMSDQAFTDEIVARNREVQEKKAAEEAARKAAEEAERVRKAKEEEAKRAKEEAERRAAEEAARKAAEEAERARKAAEEAEAARKAAEAAAQAAAQGQFAEAVEIGKTERAGTIGREMADFAATFVGVLPYVWGGASLTTGADCSGFCGQILAHFGFVSQERANWHDYCSWNFRDPGFGRDVAYEDLQPGDIVCYDGHVAMYFGCGIVVHEPNKNRKAEYGNVNMAPILAIRRFTND